MSIKVYKSQIFRPYKIEVYGLQDNYIGTLQSYDDSFIGRVQEPKVSISEDGTQEFTCSIPRYYINPKTNEKRINPRWEDVSNGVLAENTRVLKVFVETDGEKKVFPFIVDKIVDKRDAHFSVYKEVTGSGLAFAELGKIGLKLELNSHTVETDYEKDNSTVATLDYWLDKVFPRDESGRWLTPWCYEIRMDWSHYSDKEERLPNKVYEDAYINGWDIIEGELVPAGVTPCQEKARYINTEENSNKYNITQTLAETFGVFCIYEYKCAENGSFIKEYTDENGNIWQGRKAIFYNRAIKTDNPFMIEYQKNLQSITRTCDSSEVYTKMYVTPVESTVMTDGYVSIANTEANPLLDEFILNFDYLYEKGSINDYQKDYIVNYEKELHEINVALLEQADKIEKLTIEVNEKEAEWAGYEKSISSAQEELAHYQTLRDNEVTNTPVVKDKTNTYSVIFMKGTSIAEANIRLEGAVAGSISGYKDFEYTNQWFDGSRLRMVREKKPITQGDTNIYVLTDEYGYAIGLFTHPDNLPGKEETRPVSSDDSRSIFLALQYSPKNKYISICNNFETIIAEEQKKMDEAWALVEGKKAELEQVEEDQNDLLEQKELLNQKFERVLGPALREGYWTPDNYDDIGKKTEEVLTIDISSDEEKKTQFFFDTELFEEEETGYYYASKLDIAEERKTYYGYIDLSNYYKNWKEENQWYDLDKLVVYLQNPSFVYTAPQNVSLTAGNYYIIYNTKYYYFSLKEDLVQDDQLEAKIIIDQQTKELNFAITKNGAEISVSTEPPAKEEGQDYDIPVNVTNIFENIGSYLGEHKLFPDGGFMYSFIKGKDNVIPVLLLNDVEINYKNYTQVAYSFDEINYELFHASDIVYSSTENAFSICYPRIVIRRENVKYDADTLIIQNANDADTLIIQNTNNAAEPLTKFEDYSVLVKDGFPYFTLKINKNVPIGALLEEPFKIVYQVSQANEMLYQDAKEVAKENSRPKFSYEVTVSQVPQNIESFELGQLGYISDSALGVHAAQGYINKITLVLDSPKDDGITIQNYKTKFEDLFSTITASSEAMKQNQRSYDIAASGFTSQGEISGSVLQNTLNNNKVELSFSNTRVEIDDVNGITLTNVDPYSNGVYGQVILRGGGVFVSGTVDENNQRIWNTGITPNGINASAITTGQLDTNLIRVFAGTNMAFQWNGEGIYAYKRDEEYGYLPDTYVHYSDKGLQFLDNGFLAVDLGWNGLNINTQDGSLSLTGNDGLVVYDGENKGYNKVVKLGRFGEENNYSYGLRLYKPTNGEYTETLITGNDGTLWLKDYIQVGNKAGISGTANDDITFWAGADYSNRDNAPFKVLSDGTIKAEGEIITTKAISSTILDTSHGLYLFELPSDFIYPTIDKTAVNPYEKYYDDLSELLKIAYGTSEQNKMKVTKEGIELVATSILTETSEAALFNGEIVTSEKEIGTISTVLTINNSNLDISFITKKGEETFDPDTKLKIDSTGILGDRASFKTLFVNEKEVLGNNARIIVAGIQPEAEPIDIIWIKPVVITTSSMTCYMGYGKSVAPSVQHITNFSSPTGILDTVNNVTYTITFPIHAYNLTKTFNGNIDVRLQCTINGNTTSLSPEGMMLTQKISLNSYSTAVFEQSFEAPNIFTEENVKNGNISIDMAYSRSGDTSIGLIEIRGDYQVVLSATTQTSDSDNPIQNCEVYYIPSKKETE